HYTKHKQLLLIHHHTIHPTSNRKPNLSHFTLKQLKPLHFPFYKPHKFKRHTIPTFHELLHLPHNFTERLLIQIKKPTHYPNIQNIILHKFNQTQISKSKLILQSFHFHSLKKFSPMNL
ncbi:glycerophosphodiester phosphodiesterase, partial [Staphylococcus epidermidis]|uniref:glycerophosphodiester phosphodiesterase n=1 Tax=Staphylococcus epidermidis TaxID=1282 RepID=UPI0037DA3B15